MPVQWTDDVLNAKAEGSWDLPAEVRVHTDDPGVDGSANLIADSDAVVSWSGGGVEGPLGPSAQPATVGRNYAAPSVTLASGTGATPWLSFWDAVGVFLGRVEAPSEAAAGSYQPNLALEA